MMIQIVDEKDNLIGHKERGEVDPEKDIYRSAALWLTNSKGEVLLAQRKFTKDHDPGKQGPAVSGTVDEGETYESNIYKEAEEEIGLKGETLKLGPKERVTKEYNFFCQWFTHSLDWPLEKFVPQESEVEKLAWISEQELVKDVANNPDKYLPTMDEIVKLFVKQNIINI